MAETLLNMGIAAGLILLALLGWIAVQQAARHYAARHPEFGPAKEEGGGCGGGCSCSAGGQCSNKRKDLFIESIHHRGTEGTEDTETYKSWSGTQ